MKSLAMLKYCTYFKNKMESKLLWGFKLENSTIQVLLLTFTSAVSWRTAEREQQWEEAQQLEAEAWPVQAPLLRTSPLLQPAATV